MSTRVNGNSVRVNNNRYAISGRLYLVSHCKTSLSQGVDTFSIIACSIKGSRTVNSPI